MSIVNIESEYIEVFPFGSTRADHPYDHILNEKNLSALVRHLTDYDSYVLSCEREQDADCPHTLEFVIHGYYFKATNLTDSTKTKFFEAFKDAKNIYAYISIGGTDCPYLAVGGEEEQVDTQVAATTQESTEEITPVVTFEGVHFTSEDPKVEFSLHLLKKVNDKWTAPKASQLRYVAESVQKSIELLPSQFSEYISDKYDIERDNDKIPQYAATNLQDDLQYIYERVCRVQKNTEFEIARLDGRINALDYDDKEVEHEFVTQVKQADGKITVSRKQPTIDDVDGLRTTLKEMQGTDWIKSKPSIKGNADAIAAMDFSHTSDKKTDGQQSVIISLTQQDGKITSASDHYIDITDVTSLSSTLGAMQGPGWATSNSSIKGNADDIDDINDEIKKMKGDGWSNNESIHGNADDITTIKGTGWINETIKGNADKIAAMNITYNVEKTKESDTDGQYSYPHVVLGLQQTDGKINNLVRHPLSLDMIRGWHAHERDMVYTASKVNKLDCIPVGVHTNKEKYDIASSAARLLYLPLDDIYNDTTVVWNHVEVENRRQGEVFTDSLYLVIVDVLEDGRWNHSSTVVHFDDPEMNELDYLVETANMRFVITNKHLGYSTDLPDTIYRTRKMDVIVDKDTCKIKRSSDGALVQYYNRNYPFSIRLVLLTYSPIFALRS